MPDFHLQTLHPETRNRFDRAVARLPRPLSSYALAAHLLWRDHFTFRWTEVHDHFLLFAEYDGCVYMPLPPLGPPDRAIIADCFSWMDRRNPDPRISRIENIAEEDEAFYRDAGWITEAKAPEYVYSRSALADLRGDAYKTPRGSCNAFVRRCQPTDRPYRPADQPAALALLSRWQGQRQHTDPIYRQMMLDSESVHRRALAEGEKIGLTGWVIEVNGDLVGYTFGFPLYGDTFCIALEVTDLTLSGAAAYLFRTFCSVLTGDRWINTMDDSGLENLRRVKAAYRPIRRLGCFLARQDLSPEISRL